MLPNISSSMRSSYNHNFIFWILTKHISTLLILTYVSHCGLIQCAQFNDFWEVQGVARQQHSLAIEHFCHSKRKSLAHTVPAPGPGQPPAYFLLICICLFLNIFYKLTTSYGKWCFTAEFFHWYIFGEVYQVGAYTRTLFFLLLKSIPV